MKRLKLFTIFLAILFVTVAFGDQRGEKDFLATAEASIALSTTAVNGTAFDSRSLVVPTSMATITITFTGDASSDGGSVDFYFQSSYDNGSTWTTAELIKISVDSDEISASPYLVSKSFVDWYQGISHVRLWKVVNGDATSAITLVNATLSWGKD